MKVLGRIPFLSIFRKFSTQIIFMPKTLHTPESPLWQLPNVLLTPHIAVKDAENITERQCDIFLENARRFAEGLPLQNVVDKSVWY